jgi:transcriptional regulator with XRE-family HTH domain
VVDARAAGLTIETLADEAEIDASYAARIEQATVNPMVDVLERLAKVLREPPTGARRTVAEAVSASFG